MTPSHFCTPFCFLIGPLSTCLTLAPYFPTLITQSSRSVVDSVQLSQLREEGKEAASFLRTSLVQATATDRGTYGELEGAVLCGSVSMD